MPMQTRSMTRNNEKKAVANMCENIVMDIKKYNKNQKKTLTINHHKRGKGEYEGELIDNKPHGYGKCIFDYDATMPVTYEGEWEAGEMYGNGKMTYKNGNIYEGKFHNGLMYGNGKMTYENGEVYEGQWINNCYNGKGKMTYENGDIYEGQWQWKKKHGTGKMIYENGDVYDGDWINDNKEGSGEMTYDNSNIYAKEIRDQDSWYVNSQYIVYVPGYYKNGATAQFYIFSRDIIKIPT